MSSSLRRLALGVLATALLAAACGDDGSTSSAATTTEASSAGSSTTSGGSATTAATKLADVCPATITMQTNWIATAERSAAFQLIGDKGKASQSQYVGPIGDTGVNLRIIDGGPGMGEGQQAITTLSAGNLKFNIPVDIAWVGLSDLATYSKQFPSVGVVSLYEKDPVVLFWDPATYSSGFHSLDDLKRFAATGNKIYVSTIKSGYGRYLVNAGVPKDAFIEGYAGDSEKFLVNGGKWLNQGYGTSSGYEISHLAQWNKPIDYVYVKDLGYDSLASVLAVSAAKLDSLRPCLKLLVPLIQQAQVDYVANPTVVNKVITDYNDKGYGASYWKTPLPLTEATGKALSADKIVANNSAGTLGSFDMTRAQKIVDQSSPYFDDRAVKGVTADKLVTNEFIDPKIGLK